MDLRKGGADDDIWNSSTIHEVIKDGKQLWTKKKKNYVFRFVFNQGINSCVSIDTGNGVTVKMPVKICLYTDTTIYTYIY